METFWPFAPSRLTFTGILTDSRPDTTSDGPSGRWFRGDRLGIPEQSPLDDNNNKFYKLEYG